MGLESVLRLSIAQAAACMSALYSSGVSSELVPSVTESVSGAARIIRCRRRAWAWMYIAVHDQ